MGSYAEFKISKKQMVVRFHAVVIEVQRNVSPVCAFRHRFSLELDVTAYMTGENQ